MHCLIPYNYFMDQRLRIEYTKKVFRLQICQIFSHLEEKALKRVYNKRCTYSKLENLKKLRLNELSPFLTCIYIPL